MSENSELLDAPERLGEITVPSGVVLVLDAGLLNLWRHDKPPVLPDGTLSSPEALADANASLELQVRGSDAREAGIAYDRSCHPLYLYDVPESDVSERISHFEAYTTEHGFDAHLVPLERRVTHRERVAQLVADGVSENGISFHHIWAAVVADLPRDRKLTVYGRRRSAGSEFEGRWHDVFVEVREGAETARTASRGHAAVDEARLIFADADALGAWVHDDPLDGMADLVFWGADAPEAAAATGAGRVREEGYGWCDLPIQEAIRKETKVERLRDEHGWRFATDFRPHSHHWQAMQQVRASETESGTVVVGGAEMCVFMTSWGDGIFEIYADYDADDRLARIRAVLGSENTLARMRALNERYFGAFAKMALVSKRVFEDGNCARFLYREAPDVERDSGWRVFAGGESDDYANDADNIAPVPLRELIDRDKKLEALFRQPESSVFERAVCGDDFERVTDWAPEEGW